MQERLLPPVHLRPGQTDWWDTLLAEATRAEVDVQCEFTHGQHGRGQQPPGEELQEDHHHRMSHSGSAPAELQIAERKKH